MSRIHPTFIKHELNVLPKARPVKQQGRRFVTKQVDAIIKEVENLKKVSAIAEILYPELVI